jgi:ribosome-associated protein
VPRPARCGAIERCSSLGWPGGATGANDAGVAASEPSQSDQPEGVELAPGVRVPEGVLRFSFVASGGPGGQNVNKRATKAELRVSVCELGLTERIAARFRRLAGARMTDSDEIIITSDEHRTQGRNRAACLGRLRDLIVEARAIPKSRRPTRPTRGSIERRLEDKRQRSQTKRRRRPPEG